MAFTQFKLDRSVLQARGIFNKYVYETSDSITDIQVAGYFSESRFASIDDDSTNGMGWNGGIIECQCSDGYFIGIIDGSTGTLADAGVGGGGDVISDLTPYQVPMKDPTNTKLVYAGATVDETTGEWTFDKSINVPAGSINVGDVVTLSEGGEELLVSNNINDDKGFALLTKFDETGSFIPTYIDLGAQFSNALQPDDSQIITTNPLAFSIIGGVTPPDIRQTNQVTFRADSAMNNVTARVTDAVSGVVIRYIPSRAAWDASTPEEVAADPGLDFIAGDNVVDFISQDPDSPGVFNLGLSPFRLVSGQQIDVEIKADSMSLKGNLSDQPYLTQLIQEGPLVELAVSDHSHPLTTVLYVDGGTDSIDRDGSITNPFATITEAYDSVTDNSISKQYVFRITPATYMESSPLILKPYISLEGFGQATRVIIETADFEGSSAGTYGLQGITFDGVFTFDVSALGGSSLSIANCTITGDADFIGGGAGQDNLILRETIIIGAATFSDMTSLIQAADIDGVVTSSAAGGVADGDGNISKTILTGCRLTGASVLISGPEQHFSELSNTVVMGEFTADGAETSIDLFVDSYPDNLFFTNGAQGNLKNEVDSARQGFKNDSTTLVRGGEITEGSLAVQIDIAAGVGTIYDYADPSNPLAFPVTFGPFTDVSLTFSASENFSIIAIDRDGSVQQFAPGSYSFLERRDYITLGTVTHSSGIFEEYFRNSITTQETHSQFLDLLDCLGVIKCRGLVAQPNADLTFDKTSGIVMNPGAGTAQGNRPENAASLLAESPTIFNRFLGLTGDTSATGQTDIDPNNYDDGSGSPVPVPAANQATIQYIFQFPADGTSIVMYGQTVYPSLLDAVSQADSDNPTIPDFIRNDALLIARIAVEDGATDLTDENEAILLPGSKFGVDITGGGGGSGAGGGDVLGPASSESNEITTYSDSTGKILRANSDITAITGAIRRITTNTDLHLVPNGTGKVGVGDATLPVSGVNNKVIINRNSGANGLLISTNTGNSTWVEFANQDVTRGSVGYNNSNGDLGFYRDGDINEQTRAVFSSSGEFLIRKVDDAALGIRANNPTIKLRNSSGAQQGFLDWNDSNSGLVTLGKNAGHEIRIADTYIDINGYSFQEEEIVKEFGDMRFSLGDSNGEIEFTQFTEVNVVVVAQDDSYAGMSFITDTTQRGGVGFNHFDDELVLKTNNWYEGGSERGVHIDAGTDQTRIEGVKHWVDGSFRVIQPVSGDDLMLRPDGSNRVYFGQTSYVRGDNDVIAVPVMPDITNAGFTCAMGQYFPYTTAVLDTYLVGDASDVGKIGFDFDKKHPVYADEDGWHDFAGNSKARAFRVVIGNAGTGPLHTAPTDVIRQPIQNLPIHFYEIDGVAGNPADMDSPNGVFTLPTEAPSGYYQLNMRGRTTIQTGGGTGGITNVEDFSQWLVWMGINNSDPGYAPGNPDNTSFVFSKFDHTFSDSRVAYLTPNDAIHLLYNTLYERTDANSATWFLSELRFEIVYLGPRQN